MSELFTYITQRVVYALGTGRATEEGTHWDEEQLILGVLRNPLVGRRRHLGLGVVRREDWPEAERNLSLVIYVDPWFKFTCRVH